MGLKIQNNDLNVGLVGTWLWTCGVAFHDLFIEASGLDLGLGDVSQSGTGCSGVSGSTSTKQNKINELSVKAVVLVSVLWRLHMICLLSVILSCSDSHPHNHCLSGKSVLQSSFTPGSIDLFSHLKQTMMITAETLHCLQTEQKTPEERLMYQLMFSPDK